MQKTCSAGLMLDSRPIYRMAMVGGIFAGFAYRVKLQPSPILQSVFPVCDALSAAECSP